MFNVYLMYIQCSQTNSCLDYVKFKWYGIVALSLMLRPLRITYVLEKKKDICREYFFMYKYVYRRFRLYFRYLKKKRGKRSWNIFSTQIANLPRGYFRLCSATTADVRVREIVLFRWRALNPGQVLVYGFLCCSVYFFIRTRIGIQGELIVLFSRMRHADVLVF